MINGTLKQAYCNIYMAAFQHKSSSFHTIQVNKTKKPAKVESKSLHTLAGFYRKRIS